MIDWRIYDQETLGYILVEEGNLTTSKLEEAIKISKEKNQKFLQVLLENGYLTEEEIIDFFARKLSIDKVDLSDMDISEEIIDRIPKEMAVKYNLIPFDEDKEKIFIALNDPTNLLAIDDARFITGKIVCIHICNSNNIKNAINKYYNKENSDKAIEDLKEEYKDYKDENEITEETIAEVENAPAVRLANSILSQAINMKASDIHIEPFENEVIVRYRTDGTLTEVMKIPKNLYSSVSTRFKIISEMDIAEKRIPQDGRIEMKIGNVAYDFRVSSLPTVFGEKIVLRVLDRNAFRINREMLGFAQQENALLDKILSIPHGILLVTGPTGSGKTTTLYSFLKELNTPDKNITTIEDPAEYRLDRINQVQVNNKAGLTFAAGLRSMLRQDPDVIMIGEIRDEETAQIAVKAAITGHFVLSTLHTNDAPSTVTRLLDMGIESYLVSDAVIGIIAQRLVRKLCPECKEMYLAKEYEKKILGNDEVTILYTAKGCSKCSNTGYKGRVGIHEVMYIDKNLRQIIETSQGADKIREVAVKNGMITLFESCKKLVERGETSIAEMLEVVHERD